MSDELKEVVSGSIAGAVGKLFEYPFDTAKVRLQAQSLSSPQYSGAVDCLIQTFKNEGLLGMYKGVSAPIVAAAAENAVLFGCYNAFDESLSETVSNFSARTLIAGTLSGVTAAFVLTPIELVKCQVQVNAESKRANIWQLVQNTYHSGGIFGFWRGHLGTVIREGGGSAAWFGTYYALKDKFGSLLAGAAAGISYNLSLFPADSIKSRMQTDRIKNNRSLSFLQTGRDIIQKSGIRGLYRGSLVTCVRAGPSNAVIFSVHDYIRRSLN